MWTTLKVCCHQDIRTVSEHFFYSSFVSLSLDAISIQFSLNAYCTMATHCSSFIYSNEVRSNYITTLLGKEEVFQNLLQTSNDSLVAYSVVHNEINIDIYKLRRKSFRFMHFFFLFTTTSYISSVPCASFFGMANSVYKVPTLRLHPVFSNYHLLKASWVHSKPSGGNSICIALRQSHAQVLSC